MTVRNLEHINICTPDMVGTAGFFADVLGMTVSPSPGSDDVRQAAWIRDAEGRPIIHLASTELMARTTMGAGPAGEGSGRIHHVALACSGYETVVARLAARGLPARERRSGDGRRVIFVAESNGIMLELNFYGE